MRIRIKFENYYRERVFEVLPTIIYQWVSPIGCGWKRSLCFSWFFWGFEIIFNQKIVPERFKK